MSLSSSNKYSLIQRLLGLPIPFPEVVIPYHKKKEAILIPSDLSLYPSQLSSHGHKILSYDRNLLRHGETK